jgi:HEAT repeat protein
MSSIRTLLPLFVLSAIAAAPLLAADEEQLEQWRETVRYGIDSELSSVMEQLKESDTSALNEELFERYQSTLSDSVRQEILSFYTDVGYDGAEEAARTVVEDFRRKPTELVLQAVRYLSQGLDDPGEESRTAIRELIDSGSGRVATAGVRALGRIGGSEDGEYLAELVGDRSTAGDVRNEAILALGSLEYDGATEMLTDMAMDDGLSVTPRRYAIDSLGKIGNEQAVPTLREIAGSQNARLRAQAAYALRSFESDEVTQLLVSMLRDSNASVRTQALQALAEREPGEGVDAIRYKATHDPEPSVQAEAMKTLVKLEQTDAVAELATDTAGTTSSRVRAVQALADSTTPAAAEALQAVVEEEADATTPSLTIQLARSLSQRSEIPEAMGPLLELLLRHSNRTVQLYTIQAVARAELVDGYAETLSSLTESSSVPAVRSAASQVLPEETDESQGNGGGDDGGENPDGADAGNGEAMDGEAAEGTE